MIVAGTGHRPNKLGGYSPLAFNKLCNIAEEWLKENKPELVISGMALGWDQALAVSAAKVGIPFDAYIPFVGQEKAWPTLAQLAYIKLLKMARCTVVVSKGEYSPDKMQRRNEAMVNACTHVLAMYNGDLNGGTYNCIKYAKAKNKPIINLYNQFNT